METDEIGVSECVRKDIKSMSIIPFIIANNTAQMLLRENERREQEERERREQERKQKRNK